MSDKYEGGFPSDTPAIQINPYGETRFDDEGTGLIARIFRPDNPSFSEFIVERTYRCGEYLKVDVKYYYIHQDTTDTAVVVGLKEPKGNRDVVLLGVVDPVEEATRGIDVEAVKYVIKKILYFPFDAVQSGERQNICLEDCPNSARISTFAGIVFVTQFEGEGDGRRERVVPYIVYAGDAIVAAGEKKVSLINLDSETVYYNGRYELINFVDKYGDIKIKPLEEVLDAVNRARAQQEGIYIYTKGYAPTQYVGNGAMIHINPELVRRILEGNLSMEELREMVFGTGTVDMDSSRRTAGDP